MSRIVIDISLGFKAVELGDAQTFRVTLLVRIMKPYKEQADVDGKLSWVCSIIAAIA
jgi:hypothetical protein